MKVNVTNTEGKDIVIRKGGALEALAPRSISINGTLKAPVQFLAGKTFDDGLCHIRVFNHEGRLELYVQDTDPHTQHVITGSLSKDAVLEQFKINTNTRWSVSEFLKFIKTMRFYFADKAAHGKLIESIQKWSVTVERVINEHNDNKGNSNFQLQTKVQAVPGLVSIFDLNVPIFQGYPKVKFSVEIGLDPKNTEVMIYLISDELIELEIGAREKAIKDVLAELKDRTFSKIVVS